MHFFFFFLLQIICWRDVPTDSTTIGQVARKSEPYMRQVFVTGDQEFEELNRQVNFYEVYFNN